MSAAHTQNNDHGHDHHEPGFIGKYVFSTDHKVIGIQYAITGLLFLLFGFFLMLLMRWSIAYPGQPIPGFDLVSKVPVLGWLFNEMIGRWAPGGVVNGELYNMLGAMHGTIMVFLGIVPLGFAVRQFRDALANWDDRYGFSSIEHVELLALLCEWCWHVGKFLSWHGFGANGLDDVFAASKHHGSCRNQCMDAWSYLVVAQYGV
jgi:hypothetical protein